MGNPLNTNSDQSIGQVMKVKNLINLRKNILIENQTLPRSIKYENIDLLFLAFAIFPSDLRRIVIEKCNLI